MDLIHGVVCLFTMATTDLLSHQTWMSFPVKSSDQVVTASVRAYNLSQAIDNLCFSMNFAGHCPLSHFPLKNVPYPLESLQVVSVEKDDSKLSCSLMFKKGVPMLSFHKKAYHILKSFLNSPVIFMW